MSLVHKSFERLADDAGMAVWWHEYCDGEGPPFVAQYHVQGKDGGAWQVAVNSQQPCCTVTEGRAENPDLTLIFSDADWLEIVTGRPSVWSLLASGRILADGDETLIGDLNLLGLLGPSVTTTAVSACSHQGWLSQRPWLGRDALWVLPRVLTAGRIDHDKWVYFARRGDLRIEIPSQIPWRTLSEPAAAPYAATLRTVLRPLYWRHFVLRSLPATPIAWLLTAISVMLLGFAVIGATPGLFLLLLLAGTLWLVAAWMHVTARLHLDSTYLRAREVLTGFALQDADFFKLATDSALIQIGQSHRIK